MLNKSIYKLINLLKNEKSIFNSDGRNVCDGYVFL